MFYAHIGYTKTNADRQSTATTVNKSAQLGYMCTHLTANVVSSSSQTFPQSSPTEKRTKIEKLQRRTELVSALLSDYLHQNEKQVEDHVCSLAGAVRVSESCP